MRKLLAISFAAKYMNVVIQLGVMSILSRLLTPEEFGVVSIVTVLVAFFGILGNSGISTAIVQNRTLDSFEISSIYKLTLVFALFLSVLFAAIANPLASFYGDKRYVEIVYFLSITVFLSVSSMVPMAVLQREMKFSAIGKINFSGSLVAGVVAIASAYHGASSFSIVYQSIVLNLIIVVLSMRASRLVIHKGFSRTGIDKIMSYSLYQFSFNFVNYFSRNADNMLIGKFLGPTQLGYYGRAYQLMLFPLQQLTFVVSQVLHPVFAEKQEDRVGVYDHYVTVAQALAFIGVFLGAVCVFNSSEIILIFFGGQWGAAVKPFSILSFSIPFQLVCSSSGAVFQAINDTRRLFFVGLLNSVLILLSFSIAMIAWGDLDAVSIGVAIGYIVVFFTTFFVLIKMSFRFSYRLFLLKLVPFAFSGVVASSFLYFLDISFLVNPLLLIACKSVVFFVVYVICTSFFLSGRQMFYKIFKSSRVHA